MDSPTYRYRYVRHGVDDWLAITPAFEPVGIIHRGFVTTPDTHETVQLYRVVRWALESSGRKLVGYFETEFEAKAGAETIGSDLQRQHESVGQFAGYPAYKKSPH